ncbi:AMIN domain-containing protein [Alteromonadaceae bacterium M269]|nr:AMIN domain-containing protein [Alteromonadaceae bacterium M269]
MWAGWFLVAVTFFAFNVKADTNQIESVRIWPSPNSTRVVIDLKEAPEFTYFSLDNPQRLVVDLKQTKKQFDFSKIANQSNLVRKIRSSKPKNNQSTRLVLELTKRVKPQLFALPPTPPYKNRLVIDLVDPDGPATVVKDAKSDPRARDVVVAIDAGHGGEDPGSIGSAGTYEKNITLSISKHLQRLIDKEPGMSAYMIRSGDYYILPNRRPELARQNKADLLISIHADAFTTPQPSGASVWTLSVRRANSELGRWMEQTEKHSELLGGAAEVIQDTTNERYLAQALLDMSMDHSLATSFELSEEMISQMKQVTKMHKKRPQSASLAVLTAPDIPSVLVETGFISNPREEKNLNWDKHRRKLAQAIFTATKRFFQKSPPDGTLWAKQRQESRTHRVRRGDSLSLLAQRYNVKVSDIKSANSLKNDTVRVGQVLSIPQT